MTTDTSINAYLTKVYPTLGLRQATVLHYLRNAGENKTNAEIAQGLGLPINTITPRTLELRTQGLVLRSVRRTCKVTGGTAWSWKAKYPVLPPARVEKPPAERRGTLL